MLPEPKRYLSALSQAKSAMSNKQGNLHVVLDLPFPMVTSPQKR